MTPVSKAITAALFATSLVAVATDSATVQNSGRPLMRLLPRPEASMAIGGTTCQKYHYQTCVLAPWDDCEGMQCFIPTADGEENLKAEQKHWRWCNWASGSGEHHCQLIVISTTPLCNE
jgi:hypothetical protein